MGAYEHKFKVGDRVKRKNYGHGNFDVGDIGVVAAVSGDDISLKGDRDGFTHRVENLEPETLTIEAGKFYKTRDGRKVGPIARGRIGSAAWYWEAPSVDLEYECAWYQNGSFFSGEEHKMDLIAEWVDEPAVAVAASNDNAAQAKFKVGDRVEVVIAGDTHQERYVGTIFTIDSDEGDFDGQQSWAGRDHGSPYRWKESQLKLSPVATPTAIVALIENGQPKPATRPYVHATEAAAANEADRLADLHKGQEFAVFVLTSSRKRAAPAYAFEWQRLAAKGEKIAAIKELRAVTGMPLRQSKDVVEHFVDSPYGEIAA